MGAHLPTHNALFSERFAAGADERATACCRPAFNERQPVPAAPGLAQRVFSTSRRETSGAAEPQALRM